jgi:hypothetical protein
MNWGGRRRLPACKLEDSSVPFSSMHFRKVRGAVDTLKIRDIGISSLF